MKIEKKLALQVNDILGQYIAIHDDILKFSWRRIIPIPRLFKAIDYKAHYQDLDKLITHLMAVTALTINLKQRMHDEDGNKIDQGFANILEEYSRALLDSIQRLHDICKKLYLKSEGEKGYKMSTYNAEMDEYKESVTKYVECGERLNSAYSRLQ